MSLRILPEAEWAARADRHAERVRPWVADRLARRSRGTPHAVWDFLFDYYPYSPAKLATWHPGVGAVLSGAGARSYLALPGYREVDGGVTADVAILEPRRDRPDFAIRILEGTSSRPAMTGCFGLHEWAMAYRLGQEQLRHASLPLRVPSAAVAATVESVGLRCTHIDAYRFFAPEATPLNEHVPTRASQPDLEQPGCLHAAMDLYKWAAWFAPLVGSDLVADCFENAARARELDMRASPYDVTAFGLQPVPVETAEGRREYARLQADLMDCTGPLRQALLGKLQRLRAADAG